MPIFIGTLSQKGGVGKSTLARLIAREYANAGWDTKIADLDVSQGTSYNWQARRLQNGIEPVIAVERFGTPEQAYKATAHHDLVIFDGPPYSNAGTLKVAMFCDLVVLPTGLSLDDLEPSILLAHELVKKGVSRTKIVFALCRAGESNLEIQEARNYIKNAGYQITQGAIPEKIAYRRASDEGRAVTETRFPSLNERSDEVAQSIVDLITNLPKKGI